jgi:hypothetical protein
VNNGLLTVSGPNLLSTAAGKLISASLLRQRLGVYLKTVGNGDPVDAVDVAVLAVVIQNPGVSDALSSFS